MSKIITSGKIQATFGNDGINHPSYAQDISWGEEVMGEVILHPIAAVGQGANVTISANGVGLFEGPINDIRILAPFVIPSKGITMSISPISGFSSPSSLEFDYTVIAKQVW